MTHKKKTSVNTTLSLFSFAVFVVATVSSSPFFHFVIHIGIVTVCDTDERRKKSLKRTFKKLISQFKSIEKLFKICEGLGSIGVIAPV